MKYDPDRPIKTGGKIAAYMGYSRSFWQQVIAPRMLEYSCLYKVVDKTINAHAYHYITTPYLIRLWIVMSQFNTQFDNIIGSYKFKNKKQHTFAHISVCETRGNSES